MLARHAVAVVTLLSFSPALAENLDAEAARRFIVGKLFAFTCADGSRGAARVYDDGSVIGTIQFHGWCAVQMVSLREHMGPPLTYIATALQVPLM